MRTFRSPVFILAAAVLAALFAPPAEAARQCPDTPGSSCKGDSGGWWPDDDDIMRIGAGTGTATVCRHRHAVPYASYCYQLSSTCAPDVPIPMRRHSNPNRDGWRSVTNKIAGGGWCVDACAVVNVPPWAPWTKIPGTDYVSQFTVLIDLHDPDDPLDDEYEDREQDCWQEDRVCTEPSTTVAPCGGGPYCYLPSPQTRTQCGPSRGGGDPPPPPPCTPARYSWSQWTPAEPCVTGTGGITQTQSESCTAGSGTCAAARCGTLADDRTRECAPIDPDCADQPACGSIAGICSTGNAGPVTTTNNGSIRTDAWSCSSPDPDCTTDSCSISTGCSIWQETTQETCTPCDPATLKKVCTETRSCTDGTCPTTGTCPSHYPIATPTTKDCTVGCLVPPRCDVSTNSCIVGTVASELAFGDANGNNNNYSWSCTSTNADCDDDYCTASDPCTNYTTSTTEACDGADWVTTTSCTDGTCISGGACPATYPEETTRIANDLRCLCTSTIPCTANSCRNMTGTEVVQNPNDRSVCIGQDCTYQGDCTPCDRVSSCSVTNACESGTEVVLNPQDPTLCDHLVCTVPGVSCAANDCTDGAWSNGAPGTVCTTDSTSRDVTCTTGADGCGANPTCPTTTTTETESGTKNCTPPVVCGCGVALFQWCTGFGCYKVNESTDVFGNTTGWDCVDSVGSTASCSI